MARVLLDRVTKKYGDVVAVDDLSLEVHDKEFLVLVGPSGCGKSSVLRMVAGVEDATSGSLYIGGTLVNDLHPKDRDIAMVFQSYALYPHMTVYDNIAFGLRMRRSVPDRGFSDGADTTGVSAAGVNDAVGADKSGNATTTAAVAKPFANTASWLRQTSLQEAAIRRRVEQVASGIGLREYLNRRPSQLSMGQRQRVALARAIVREPQVFLMDEPLSNLDANMRAQTRSELLRLHEILGVTSIYVTHDQMEAMTMGHRIAVMKNGVLQQVDTPRNLYTRPANMFVASFIGSPAMNMAMVDVQGGEGGIFVEGQGFRFRVPEQHARRLSGWTGKRVHFGIRPEHIYDAHPRLAHTRDIDPATVAEGRVDLAERMGDHIVLYVSVQNQQFVCRLDGSSQAMPGNSIRLSFDLDLMHAFDPQTERSLL